MKTLINQTLLYDEDCPLCRVYTKGFITAGMLDENGKKPYCQLSEEEEIFVDIKRASNEIALIDTKNKTVIYGINSLLKVVGHSFPWMEKVGNLKPTYYFLKKLYSFISYNRKVIIPSKINPAIKPQCVPDFNYKYRFFYIAFATIITTFSLFFFSEMINGLPKTNIARELILALGQMVFQSVFLFKFDKKTVLNYLGNLMTVSLMGSIILMPIIILHTFAIVPEIVILSWFGITVGIMFSEHFRRVKILELPSYLSFTWVLYRIIALLIILNL
ncbi:hypothetical protein [Flavobacterium sp.]|uniref:hypothetical protein n=1 Tax=Flavobacterium sp. TaxID=239 RepID=UPI00286E298E|nr:hypothetical protein [Flavobacterium sp.]